MTSLSQYMRAEQVDMTEPVSFHIPGATGWGDPRLKILRARRNGHMHDDPLYPAPDADEIIEH